MLAKRAKFWGLVGAYGLDLFLVFVGGTIFASEVEQLTEKWFALDLYGSNYWIYLLYILYLLYFFCFEGLFGNASLGKKATGICITSKNLTWWRVFMSYLIDGAIIPLSVFISFYTQSMWTSGDAVGDGMTGFFMILVGCVLYSAICEYFFRKSLGKKLMGLQVVQVSPQKQKEETK